MASWRRWGRPGWWLPSPTSAAPARQRLALAKRPGTWLRKLPDGVHGSSTSPQSRSARLIAPTLARELGLARRRPELPEADLTEAAGRPASCLLVRWTTSSTCWIRVQRARPDPGWAARRVGCWPPAGSRSTLCPRARDSVPPLHLAASGGSGQEDSEAVQLFIARARRGCRPDFEPDGAELVAVAAVRASALDGLPLAISSCGRDPPGSPSRPSCCRCCSSAALLTRGGPRRDAPQRRLGASRATLNLSHRSLFAPRPAPCTENGLEVVARAVRRQQRPAAVSGAAWIRS